VTDTSDRSKTASDVETPAVTGGADVTRAVAPTSPPETAARGADCNRCGYHRRYRVRHIEDELLTRCPRCGAYDWTPEPIEVCRG
jgi:hypothetical protein